MYKAEDCGLFIGLTTMPFGRECAFYENEIEEGIFKKYKKRLQQFVDPQDESAAAMEFESSFYKPKAYCLFGSFDLAVISLVDDFALSSRVFHPYSPLIKEGSYQAGSFHYQTITGPVPDLSNMPPTVSLEELKGSTLVRKARQTFLADLPEERKPESVFPFLGICSLKINNALLIGTGGRTVQLVLRSLKSRIENSEAFASGRLDYLIMSSFSWHEMTLLLFSDSYKLITDQILQIREMAFRDLKAFDYQGAYQRLQTNSLLSRFTQTPHYDIEDNHVFVETHTNLGYDFELLRHPEYLQQAPRWMKPWQDIEADNLKLYLRWHVKPGHLSESLKLLPPESQPHIVAGRGDFVSAAPKLDLIQLLQQLHQIRSQYKNQIDQNIRKIYTIPEILAKGESIPQSDIPDVHHSLTNYVRAQFAYSPQEIATIRKQLKRCRISKILLDKIINMYVNFNDGIQDSILYGYFIELRPFLENIRQEAQSFNSPDSPYKGVIQLSKDLQKLCRAFELAYRNRFQQSYIMNEISDYNMEFSGGIQQIVSAFDGAFKGLSTVLGCKDRFLPIAFVSSHSGIESDFYTVQLNYYHLFHPEFFLAVATHEASNFYLERLDTASGTLDAYLELHRLLNDKEYCRTHNIPDAVSYFLVDIITYYLGYNADAELFSYWHWGNFVSTSLYYNTDGSINENLFAQLMLRIFLLFHYKNRDELLSAEQPPCDVLAECWKKYYGPIRSLALSLLNKPEFQEWYSYSEVIAKEAIIDDFTGITEQRNSPSGSNSNRRDKISRTFEEILLKQHDVRNKGRFLKQYENLQDREVLLLLGRFEEMENVSNAIIDAFERGEIFERRSFDVLDSTSFRIHSLFYAYLKLLKQLNNDQLAVLKRNEDGEPDYGTPIQNCLLFDGMGGVFTRNFALRRVYFRYRSLLIKSLWHLSCKNKVKLFSSLKANGEA